jgi:hypothetical protein
MVTTMAEPFHLPKTGVIYPVLRGQIIPTPERVVSLET